MKEKILRPDKNLSTEDRILVAMGAMHGALQGLAGGMDVIFKQVQAMDKKLDRINKTVNEESERGN